MREVFSLYQIAGGNQRFNIPGTCLLLRPLNPNDFNFFHQIGLEGRERGIASRLAVRLFQQCKQYGGAMTICDSTGVLLGTVWLTQRDSDTPHFDIAVKFLEPTDYAEFFTAMIDRLVESLKSLGYAEFALHTSTLDIHTADALKQAQFVITDEGDLHGAKLWVREIKENARKEVAMLGLSL